MSFQFLLTASIVGWVAGAGANYVADHLPQRSVDSDLAATSSRSPLHNWTLLWYVPRRGICPHCGNHRLLRAPLLELAFIAVFCVTAWLLKPDPVRIAIGWSYAAFLLTVLVIDLERRRVLNIMIGPAAVVVLLLSFLPQTPSLQSSLVGAAVGLGLFMLVYFLSRGHLGMGDVKLAGLIGLMLGYPEVINALVIGIILGAVAALFLLISKRATRKSTMAYAPYLALGALFAMWWYW